MTVSTTRGTELNIDQILTDALMQAGLLMPGQPAQESDLGFARRRLDSTVAELQTDGVFAKSVQFYELTLVAGTSLYDLPPDILDLVGDAAYIDATQTSTENASGETPLTGISRGEWQALSAKGAEGRPTMYYLNRSTSPMGIRLWPIPDEAGTVRFQAHYYFADSLTGSNTVDLRKFWAEYLVWQLAHNMAVAKGFPVQRCGYLKGRADDFRKRARRFAKHGKGFQMRLDHGRATR